MAARRHGIRLQGIPKGTAHSSIRPDGRPFKAIAIETPPQAPEFQSRHCEEQRDEAIHLAT